MDPLNHPCFIHVECFSVKHRAGHWCSVTRLSALFTSGPKTVETVEAVGALNFDQKVTSTGSALWCGQWFLERPVLRRIFIHLEVKQNAAAWAQRLKDSKASHCKTSLETFRMFFLIHFDVCFFSCIFVFFVKLNILNLFWGSVQLGIGGLCSQLKGYRSSGLRGCAKSSVDKGNAASRPESELRRPQPLHGIWRAMRPFRCKRSGSEGVWGRHWHQNSVRQQPM